MRGGAELIGCHGPEDRRFSGEKGSWLCHVFGAGFAEASLSSAGGGGFVYSDEMAASPWVRTEHRVCRGHSGVGWQPQGSQHAS